MNGDKTLYGWLFTYNPFTDKWRAAKSEHKEELFSSFKGENVISSSKIETLIELIIKTDGDRDKIEKLLKKS